MNTDEVALLGHAHTEMPHRQRESIKPHLNKEWAGLCASHVSVTTFLFGDDLPARLNSIRASYRISGAVENRINYKNNYRGNFPRKSDKRRRQPFSSEEPSVEAQSEVILPTRPREDASLNVERLSTDIFNSLQVNNLILWEALLKK